MKAPGRVVSVAALGLALLSAAYVACEYGGLNSGTPDGPVVGSDSTLHPAVQPTAAPGDQTAASEQTGASAIEQEVAALRQELAQLRAVVADLRWHSRRPAEDLAPVTVVDHPRFDAHARAHEEQQQRMEAMDMRESSFLREPVDPAWSWETASRVEEALAGLAVEPSGVHDLECRANTCKVELWDAVLLTPEGDEPVSLDKGLPLLVTQLADSLPKMTSFRVADDNGSTRTVYYFSRDSDLSPPFGQ